MEERPETLLAKAETKGAKARESVLQKCLKKSPLRKRQERARFRAREGGLCRSL